MGEPSNQKRAAIAPSRRIALRPVAGAFLALGIFWGSWAVMVANIQHTFHLSNAALGLLLAVAICVAGLTGALFGHLAEHWGDRMMLATALAAWAVFLVGAAAAPDWWAFATLFVLSVVAGGCADAAMNAWVSQELAGRPGALVRFHSLFNTGALLGAAVAGIALHAGASWRVIWPGLGVLVAALGVWTRRSISREGRGRARAIGTATTVHAFAEQPSRPRSIVGSLRQLHVDGLIVLLLIFAIAEITEGGVDTWGVLYLRTHLAAGVLLGAGAYVAGQSIAAITRGAGGPLVGRLSRRLALIVGGLIAAAGILLEAGSPYVGIAAVGLALGAGGASLFWPLVMNDAVLRASYPISATSAFTAAGYVGLVAGAPLIGWIADAWGLNRGLMVLAGFAALVAVISFVRRDQQSGRAPRAVGRGPSP